ncbi:hypothetical protein HaLaN_15275, partial [Haematococcus lacustris]
MSQGLTFPEMVVQELQQLYGEEEVTGCVVLRTHRRLGGAAAAYRAASTGLEDLMDQYGSRMARGSHRGRIKVRTAAQA